MPKNQIWFRNHGLDSPAIQTKHQNILFKYRIDVVGTINTSNTNQQSESESEIQSLKAECAALKEELANTKDERGRI